MKNQFADLSLGELRQRIDAIDQQIMQLVSERARCAQAVAEVKQKEQAAAGVSGDVVYYRPEREAQVLRNIMMRNPGPLKDEEMARLFREIMSACLALEKPLTVAFPGGVGDFAHAATLKHFGRSVRAHPHAAVDDVFRDVEAGMAHYGVVPVETSREGVLGPTLDVFLRSTVRICGEVQVRTHQHLLVPPRDGSDSPPVSPSGLAETARPGLRVVYALPWVFSVCRLWLDENLSGVERCPVNSLAEALERTRENPDAALIAGDQFADVFSLHVVAHNIEDYPDQTARYLVIGQQHTPPSGKDKTSMLVAITNEPGSLHRMLEPLQRHGLSLARIESRPSPQGGRRCHFFIDVLGHEDSDAFRAALREMEGLVSDIRVLGAYPEAVL